MSNMDSLVLGHLKHICGKVDLIADDVRELKYRVSSIEGSLGSLKRDAASTQDDVYHQNAVIDSIKERLSTIQKRLALS